MSKCYIRFGNISSDAKSKIYRGDAIIGIESGVSVWECVFANNIPFPILPQNASEIAIADYFNFLFGNKPVYLVTGTELSEQGSAGEPLLKGVQIIKEYTEDYRYLKDLPNFKDKEIRYKVESEE